MKAVGVMGPDFMPRPFDVDEPTAAPNGVVVKVMAASVNDSDRAAIHGRYAGSMGQRHPMLLGRDFVGRVTAVGADVDYIESAFVWQGLWRLEHRGSQAPSPTWWPCLWAGLPRFPMASTSLTLPPWAWPGSPHLRRSVRWGPHGWETWSCKVR